MPKFGTGERIAMRAFGITPEDIEKIERSAAELQHGHEMLSAVLADEHPKIHATCSSDSPPEIKAVAENGACVYKMIGFMYARKFGMEAYEESKKKFLGVE